MENSIRTTQRLRPELSGRFKVEPDHRFIGFDAYKKVINSGVDIVMLATHPAYRPMQFEAAIEAGRNAAPRPLDESPTDVKPVPLEATA